MSEFNMYICYLGPGSSKTSLSLLAPPNPQVSKLKDDTNEGSEQK